MDRVTQRLGAESKDPGDAILPMPFGAFFELFFAGDGCANIFVTFKVELALAATGRSSPGKDRGGPTRCGSVVEKLRTASAR
jgi:hypothetical protein